MKNKNKKFTLHPLTAVFLILALKSSPWLFAVALLCSSLHELGHYIAARALGLKLGRLTVYPFGADMILTPPLRGYRTDLTVHLSGPTVNLMLGGIGYITGADELFCAYNLTLGVLNLLPILGLDGGNALFAILSAVSDPFSAHRLLNGITVVFSVVLWGVSVYVMLVLGGDPSMFFIASLAFFASAVRRASD